MQAMLLAAGLGTRLHPYTLYRPKPLFPVLNEPLLILLLDMLVQAGYERVVVNCHHLADQIEAAVAGRSEVILQHETEILGTGGGLRKALPLFADGPVLVMNGDIYHNIDPAHLMARHVAAALPVSMAMHEYQRFNSVAVRDNKVRAFSSPAGFSESGELLAFTGIHVVHTDVIRQIPKNQFFHIIDLYAELAAAGQVGSHRVDGCFWRDIGTPGDYLELHREILWAGAEEKNVPSWYISEKAAVAETVVFRDWGVIGPEVVIGENVELTRCVVWDKVVIPPDHRLKDRIICRELPET